MLGSIIIFALVAVALVGALAARRIERGLRRHRGETPGPEWAALRERIDAAHPLLDELTITRFGYDRQVQRAGSMVRNGRERILVQFNFASGFGENRHQFQCMILACPIEPLSETHAVITTDDRIAAAALAPGWRRTRTDDRWWVTNDADALTHRQTRLADWLNRQPPDRNLEFHPGLFAIYQNGPMTPDAAESLNVAADELISLIADGPTKG